MNTSIFVTFQVEGLHQWKDADNYLQHPHRHMFHFRVEASVSHDDRDLEFIAFKGILVRFIQDCVLVGDQVVHYSCEMIAKQLVDFMRITYGDRDYVVEVSEDGENGAIVCT